MASPPSQSDAPPAPSKGERTRARILEAAGEHFAAVGFEGASVPAIARQVGVSHATLYQHFGKKDELFRAAVEADLTALFAAVHPALDEPDIDPEGIVVLVAKLLAASRHHPLARRILAEINAEENTALRDSPALTALEDRLVAAIDRGQRAGTVRHDLGADHLAAGLIAVTLPLLVVALRLEGAVDHRRAGDALVFLTDSLRPPGRTTSRKVRR